MTTFSESDHPRGAGGKFAHKDHAEATGVALGAPARPADIGVPVNAAGTHYEVDARADERTRDAQARSLFAAANRRIGGTISVDGSEFVITEPAAREQFGAPNSRNRIYYSTRSGNYHSEISVDGLKLGMRKVSLPVDDDR